MPPYSETAKIIFYFNCGIAKKKTKEATEQL